MRSWSFYAMALVFSQVLACKTRELSNLSSTEGSSPELVQVQIDNKTVPIAHAKSQSWSREMRERFYYTDQGSMLIPYDYFMSLESLAGGSMFHEDKNMMRYGFLPYNAIPNKDPAGNVLNPDKLPIGFVKHMESTNDDYLGQDTKSWLGVTCAACHSQRLQVRKPDNSFAIYQIDGGSTLSNHMQFMYELKETIELTLSDESKFKAFATRVLQRRQKSDRTWRASDLKAKLQAFLSGQGLSSFRERVMRSMPVAMDGMPRASAASLFNARVGSGRLDAFGNILNEVSVRLVPKYIPMHSDAPVSYPFLWDTPDMDFVQTNATARVPLIRNIGEVLGVYGDFWISTKDGLKNKILGWALGQTVPFGSTVKFGASRPSGDGILWMEQVLRSLKAPAWSEIADNGHLPAIDVEKARLGKVIYQKTCNRCHVIPGSLETQPGAWTTQTKKVPSPSGSDGQLGPHRYRKIMAVSLQPLTSKNRVKEQGTVACAGACKERDEIRNGDVYTIAFEGQNYEAKVFDASSVVSAAVGTDTTFLRNLLTRDVTLDTKEVKQKSMLDKIRANPMAAAAIKGESTVPRALLLKIVTNQLMNRYYLDRGASLNKDGSLNMANKPDLYREYLADLNYADPTEMSPLMPPINYRARNLAGVWATAPYLHNGSVPNLRELLTPPEQRVKSFYVGSVVYDSAKMGFKSDGPENEVDVPEALTKFDTSLPGNSNAGHDFGTRLADEEKEQLMEYLKTLTSDGERPSLGD